MKKYYVMKSISDVTTLYVVFDSKENLENLTTKPLFEGDWEKVSKYIEERLRRHYSVYFPAQITSQPYENAVFIEVEAPLQQEITNIASKRIHY